MRIARYLKGTCDKGLTFTPDKNRMTDLEVFCDADFAGAYSPEVSHDPNSVRSRTGCVMMFAGCPIHWFSRIQTEIALSTTEAEYIALSTACCEALPLRQLFLEVGSYFKLPQITPTMRCNIFEDNMGAEALAKSPKMRPRTKHIAVKYHHFREAVKDKKIQIMRVHTEDQLADIFTKPVPLAILTKLRKEIQGWAAILTSHMPFSEGVGSSDPGIKIESRVELQGRNKRLKAPLKDLTAFLSFIE